MFTAEAIHGIHAELNELLAPNLVLVGGSYAWGGANEKSDLDIYVVATWINCLKIWRQKNKIIRWKQNHTGAWINVMLVPRFFYNHGWYYVIGKSLGGALYKSAFDPMVVFRTAIKLSGFYGLKYMNGGGDHWRIKAGKQLRIAWSVAGKTFSPQVYSENEMNYDWSSSELLYLAKKEAGFFKFSWKSHLLYNLRFLPKGVFTFLFFNPDRRICRVIFDCLNHERDGLKMIKWIKKVVFPVLII